MNEISPPFATGKGVLRPTKPRVTSNIKERDIYLVSCVTEGLVCMFVADSGTGDKIH